MRARLALASLAALAWAQAAAAQDTPAATVIIPDTGQLGLGTQVTQNGNVRIIDGGRLAGPNLFHSFNRFDLGRGDVAQWVRGAGDGASILNVISRVTGGDPSNIEGRIDSTALANADFYFINPAGIVFGRGAQIDVPAAAHFSTAQQLLFATGPALTMATPGGSTFSMASPAAFGFVGGQGNIVVRNGEPGFLSPGASLTLTARNVAVLDSAIGGVGFGLAAVGPGQALIDRSSPRATTAGGFLTVLGSTLRSTGGDGILLSGQDVEVRDATLGTAFSPGPRSGISGPIDIFGRDVRIFGALVSATTFGSEAAGEIRILGNNVTIDGGSMILSETARGSTGAAGQIVLDADNSLQILDRSRVSASTLSAQQGGGVLLRGDQILLSQSTVASDVRSEASGDAGGIMVQAGTLELTDASTISSTSDGLGDAGAIFIVALDRVALQRSGVVSTAQGEDGEAGLVSIKSPRLRLTDESIISTTTFTARRAGLIAIQSDDVVVAERSRIESISDARGSGDAGLILIKRLEDSGGRLLLTSGGALRSDTESAGAAGGIAIQMDVVELVEGGLITSNGGRGCSETNCAVSGPGGDIRIEANRLSLTDTDPLENETRISSDSGGAGAAGTIQLRVGELAMNGFANISSETFVSGRGGEILILADDVILRGTASLSTNTFGTGRGGNVNLDATRSLLLTDGAAILSQSGDARSFGGMDTGPGGSIRIFAPDIRVLNSGMISASTFSQAPAGSVSIGGVSLQLDGFALITSASLGAGAGGTVRIGVTDLVVAGGSAIDADSFGTCSGLGCVSGDAGNVEIDARRVTVTSASSEGQSGVRSVISSETASSGNAGDVIIRADELVVDQGSITSRTTARGNAGTVTLAVGSLSLTNGARITTSSEPCPSGCPIGGDAGGVRIAARGPVTLAGGSVITSSTSGTGAAGAIEIQASSLSLAGNSRITSSGLPGSTGSVGRVAIIAPEMVLTGGSGIETVSSSARTAGEIELAADRLRLVGAGARITSANLGDSGGSAGNVAISANGIVLLEGAQINTSAATGAAGDIAIQLPTDGFLILDSLQRPSLITTSSGPGTGGRIVIADAFAVISNGGRILALGQAGGANVRIATQYFISSTDRTNQVAVDGNFLLEAAAYDVSSGTVTRDLSVLDASGVLRGQCASARATGSVSQLVVRPVGPYGQPAVPAPPPAGATTASLLESLASCI